MRFLKFVSLLVCAMMVSFPVGSQQPVRDKLLLLNPNDIFTTTIDIYGKSINGLTVFEVTDSTTVRMLFTTVGGPKLLDMEMTPTSYKLNYAIKKLNRKAVLKALHEDFAAISGLYAALPLSSVSTNINVDSIFYKTQMFDLAKNKNISYIICTYPSGEKPHGAMMMGKKKILFDVTYFYENDALQKIVLTHENFDMEITLTRIETTTPSTETK